MLKKITGFFIIILRIASKHQSEAVFPESESVISLSTKSLPVANMASVYIIVLICLMNRGISLILQLVLYKFLLQTVFLTDRCGITLPFQSFSVSPRKHIHLSVRLCSSVRTELFKRHFKEINCK